jgi:hypothetical protein
MVNSLQMILLHGGFTYEMLGFLGGVFLLAIVILVYLHKLVKRTSFYADHFLKMTSPEKVVFYVGFLTVSSIISYFIAFIGLTLIAVIINWTLK